jgi:hypothetical protein
MLPLVLVSLTLFINVPDDGLFDPPPLPKRAAFVQPNGEKLLVFTSF